MLTMVWCRGGAASKWVRVLHMYVFAPISLAYIHACHRKDIRKMRRTTCYTRISAADDG